MAPVKRKIRTIVAAVVALVTLSVLAPVVQAQEDGVSDAVDAAVVRGTVVASTPIQLDGLPHTLFEIDVADVLAGNAASNVHVVTIGGSFPDGTQLGLSHTAELTIGHEIQVNLIAAPTATRATAAAVGIDPENVFDIANGAQGVRTISEPVGSASFAGASDFALNGVRWDSFQPPIEFAINPSGSNLTQTATIAAVREAIQDWEDDPGSNIDFTYAGVSSSSHPNLGDGVNTVTFAHLAAEGFLAQTSWRQSGGVFLEFDIVVNTKFQYTTGGAGAGTWWDLASVLRHEFGHALGLDHVSASSESLFSTITSNRSKPLGEGDIAGVRNLYPDTSASVCGDQLATVNLAKGQLPTNGDDVIIGTDGNDVIDGLDGNDIICGLGGNDNISGGLGDDTIYGDGGNDTISGDDGRDMLWGGDGADIVRGGPLADRLYGGGSDDELFGGGGWDWIYGENGADTIRGGFGSDKIFGGTGADHIFGENGPDKIEGGDGADVIDAGKGPDQVDGGDGIDSISGNNGPDTLSGGNGADVVNGNKGADVLRGQSGDDEIIGEGGWDNLEGGDGSDYCDGGFGQDTAQTCEEVVSTP